MVRRAGAAAARPSMAALILVTGTTALATDTYIAALPALRSSLHASAAAVQLTLTVCIGGLAVGQLLAGPVSDARGRRRLVLAVTLVYAATSVVCALASTVGLMLAARAVQGLAAGAAFACGRAAVTDSFRGRAAAARFGTLSAVSLVAPVVGPGIGGLLLTVGDWRAIFWFLAAVGLAMFVAAFLGLPETLPAERRQPSGLRQLAHRSLDLMGDARFITPVLVQCFTTAGFFIYIGGSSLVLQQGLGLSPGAYSLLFSGNALAMITSSVLFRLLVVRVGPWPLRRAAMTVQVVAVLALLGVALAAAPEPPALPAVALCLAGMTFGLGAYYPANAAIAQEAGRRSAGTASALSGGLPFLAGAATTPLTGALGAQTVLAMSGGMAVFFGGSALAALASRILLGRRALSGADGGGAGGGTTPR